MDVHEDDDVVCRICRSESTQERPLFHPCLCSGSIKHVHQDCLEEWLQHKNTKRCELCSHTFSFVPVYRPDSYVPFEDTVDECVENALIGLEHLWQLTLRGLIWMCVVPYMVFWSYRVQFHYSSLDDMVSLPGDMASFASDVFLGFMLVFISFSTFGLLLWLVYTVYFFPRFLDEDEPIEGDNNPRFNFNPLELLLENPVDFLMEENPDDERGNRENDPLIFENVADMVEKFCQLFEFDKYYLFVPHALLVIVMCALHTLLFLRIPFALGSWAINTLHLQDLVDASQLQTLVTILFGNCLYAMMLLILQTFSIVAGYESLKNFTGEICIALKVTLFLVYENFILPLTCGWLLNICLSPMFVSDLKHILSSSYLDPVISLIIYWIVGAAYIYICFSCINLLADVVHSSDLWFLENLTIPNFSTRQVLRQELIDFGVWKNGRNYIILTVIFVANVFLTVWLPRKILEFMWPSFLPLEFDHCCVHLLGILLYFDYQSFPVKLNNFCDWCKIGLHLWCTIFSHLLGLQTYPSGIEDEPIDQPETVLVKNALNVFRRYSKCDYFAIRLFALLLLASFSLVIISLAVIVIPVWLGCMTMSLLSVLSLNYLTVAKSPNYELYTAVWGLNVCWLLVRAVFSIEKWRDALNRMKFYLKTISKTVFVIIKIFGAVPYMIGLLVKLSIMVPIHDFLNQTSVFCILETWDLGLWIMIICTGAMGLVIIMIPSGCDLDLLIKDLLKHIILIISLSLALPYVLAYSIVPSFVNDETLKLLIARRIYPTFMIAVFVIVCVRMLVFQFKMVEERIKIKRFLVCWTLINFNGANQTN